MKVKKSNLVLRSQNKLPGMELLAVAREQEHEWRELLQKQLADHWLKLNYPEEIKTQERDLRKNPRFRSESCLRKS